MSVPSCNQQNYPINYRNFRRPSSKHLITFTPKIYPFFSKSLSKISSANSLPGLLPMGQVRRQSYLPEPKIYLSWTTGRGLFRALPHTAINDIIEKSLCFHLRCAYINTMLIKTYGCHWLEKNLLLNQGFDCNSMTKICRLSVTRRCYSDNRLPHKFSQFTSLLENSVDFISSENSANNFAEECTFHTNWNSVK